MKKKWDTIKRNGIPLKEMGFHYEYHEQAGQVWAKSNPRYYQIRVIMDFWINSNG